MRNMPRMLITAACGLAVVFSLQTQAHAATSTQILACQKAFESAVRGFSALASTQLLNCTERVVECKLAQAIDGIDPTSCLATASSYCANVPTKVANSRASKESRVNTKCVLLSLAEVEDFVGGLGFFNVFNGCSAGNLSDLVTCVFSDSKCALEHEAFIIDPRAQDSLTTAGVAGSFPCVGP
jgi:hypothetical protein